MVCRPAVGQLSAVCRSTVGEQSTVRAAVHSKLFIEVKGNLKFHDYRNTNTVVAILCTLYRDLLFREIYDKFCEDPVGKVVFLESLEPHILSDK